MEKNSINAIFVRNEDWIPCSERMPRPGDWVYVKYWDAGKQKTRKSVMQYSRKVGLWITFGMIQYSFPVHGMRNGVLVTAWSPMPQWWEGHGTLGGNEQGLPEKLNKLERWKEQYPEAQPFREYKAIRAYHFAPDHKWPYDDAYVIWSGNRQVYMISGDPERAERAFIRLCKERYCDAPEDDGA